jgi:F-box domain
MDECFLLRLPVEILLRIFGCLEVISILRFRSICGCAYNTGQLVWSVDRTLKRFVNDPIAFRTKMKDNGAAISGGLALQFFANRIWKESDMDVFVRTDMERIALMEYLVMKEGYEDDV